ncbi:hypothetical protein cypCar_00001898 [Cyprinus carpio]|nr:hypothetical protein cypCar_00001898 [Cyprinus carpio]
MCCFCGDLVLDCAHHWKHPLSEEAQRSCDQYEVPDGPSPEYEIDKALNIRGLEDVAKMGIAEYNKQCRSIVMRYANEWVLKQLYDKGLVYRGVKVMPFSTACNTPLSNFEAQQNYKQDVQYPSVIVSFPLLEDEAVSFLACTTTPWTLPSNLALCVSPDFIYVKFYEKYVYQYPQPYKPTFSP